jgi:glucosylceramidase
MKAGGAGYDDGSSTLADYPAYEKYIASFIKAYAAQNITINDITPQNEPGANPSHSPGMNLSAGDERTLVSGLASLFTKDHLSTKILAYDGNWDTASRWGLSSLLSSDPGEIAGTAWHCGGKGASPTSMTSFTHYPDLLDFITECSGTGPTTATLTDENSVNAAQFGSNLNWESKNLIVGGINNGASGVLLYNLALNDQCGPQLGHGTRCVSAPAGSGCGDCRGVVTIGDSGGTGTEVNYNVEYWLLAQASAAFLPGGHELGISNQRALVSRGIAAAAASNPDGTIGLYVSNQSHQGQTITVDAGGKGFTFSVHARSVASFRWLERG